MKGIFFAFFLLFSHTFNAQEEATIPHNAKLKIGYTTAV